MEKIHFSNLEIHKHKENFFSIKDLNNDINLSDFKWQFIFDLLMEDTVVVYFRGVDLNYDDGELYANIDFLKDDYSFFTNRERKEICFRVKMASVVLNRGLLATVWNYYWSAGLYFLSEKETENSFVNLLKNRASNANILEEILGVKTIYMGVERDVIWMEHNFEAEISFNEKC